MQSVDIFIYLSFHDLQKLNVHLNHIINRRRPSKIMIIHWHWLPNKFYVLTQDKIAGFLSTQTWTLPPKKTKKDYTPKVVKVLDPSPSGPARTLPNTNVWYRSTTSVEKSWSFSPYNLSFTRAFFLSLTVMFMSVKHLKWVAWLMTAKNCTSFSEQ